jgi:hypothetical protein
VRRGVLPEALKEERKMNLNQNLSNSKIEGLKAGISDIMQGLVTLNKVLTMIQVPESAKYPDGRSQLHDSHVEAFKRHHGIQDAHVQASVIKTAWCHHISKRRYRYRQL